MDTLAANDIRKDSTVSRKYSMHSFGYYFKKGHELTKLVFKKLSLLDKILLGLYFLGSLIGKLIFFIRPVFLIADQNIALMISETHDLEINKIFEGVNNKRRYTSLLLSNLYIDIIILGIAVALVVPFAIYLPFALRTGTQVLPISLMSFGGVVGGIIAVIMVLAYFPQGYVTTKGQNLSAGDILLLSKQASKGNRGKIFLIYFLNYLIISAVLSLVILVFYVFFINTTMNNRWIFSSIIIGILLIYSVLEISVFPLLKVRTEVSLYCLCQDAVETKHIVIARRNASDKEEYVAIFTDDMEDK